MCLSWLLYSHSRADEEGVGAVMVSGGGTCRKQVTFPLDHLSENPCAMLREMTNY